MTEPNPSSSYHFSDVDEQQLHLADVIDHDFRAQNLFRLVQQYLGEGSILDVGCGTGALVSSLLKEDFDVSGIDISPQTIKVAKQYLQNKGQDPSRVNCQDIKKLIDEGRQYDHIISLDCLEHVENDKNLFDQLISILRPGGYLIVSVPALSWLYGEKDRKIGHYRRYDPASLKKLFESHPLTIEIFRFWNGLGVLPTYISQRILKKSVNESFRYGKPTMIKKLTRATLFQWFRLIENPIPSPLGLTLLAVAVKK